MLTTRIVLLLALLTLGACATSPKYVAADRPDGYGHSSQKIEENRYRVNFNGSRKTGFQDTRDYALLRAAEVTLDKGYDWFQVVDRESLTTVARQPEPQMGIAYRRAYHTTERCGLLSCSRTSRPAHYGEIDYDTSRPTERHMHSLEIVMGKGEIPADGSAYVAKDVVSSLQDKA